LRGFGLASTTLGGTARKLGNASPADASAAVGRVKRESWSCELCTYANSADHGRCGESASTAVRQPHRADNQKCAERGQMVPCLMTYIEIPSHRSPNYAHACGD
jgi:hypothetical protein